ncbi:MULTISPECIES: SDR family NAD(P)-dependent oxidoreductase [Nocardia]|uniref:KR domain-containing protein n=2 Tax=Nocardia TaxID=1817 RepID=A0A2T2Z8Z6_9NOCA|nr:MULTISPECIES: SDR family NAD(P)-dependent oxidoreductase [Nocardia]MBF6446247.1 SDR family NAD(P)-dependent oxidoreductase [Nocardia elegans]PSR64234.1 KR domain-containing protein [Nocardia nova]
MTAPATWFVTGASRGLGLELVKQLLARGENVAATSRSADRLLAALDGIDIARLLPLTVDLADESQVSAAVRHALDRFGSVEVVVNNAGYGYLSAVEEVSDADARRMFDIQVFGVWNVLRALLPHLRTRGRGHIVNISSVLGITTVPGWGLYSAGKFALEGLTEALAGEVAEHGVRVTLVEPGYFRTDFLTTDSLALPAATTDGYESIRRMTGDHLAMQGTQLGDPVRGAAAILALVDRGDGPLRQLLGSDARTYATSKVEALRADIEAGAELALSTDTR